MKNGRILLATFILAGLEGLVIVLTMFAAPSAQANVVFAGLSGPRLALAGFLLVGSVVSGGLGLVGGLVPGWRRIFSARLDRLAACPQRLLTVSFLLLSLGLAAPTLAGVLLSSGLTRILERIAPAVIWIGLVSLQALLGLVWVYRAEYRKPGFFHHVSQKLAHILFLEHAGVWACAGLLVVAAGTLFAASSISSGRGRVLGHDSGIFLYFGRQILAGDLPFRDLWDHKPPLIFYIDALGLWIGQGSLWGVWALEFASLTTGGLLGYLALRAHFPRPAAFLAAAAALAHAVFFLEGGNLTEEFALPLQWAALYLAFSRPKRIGWLARAALCGALFAVALGLKQTMVGIWLALSIYLILAWVFTHRSGMGKGALCAVLGAVSVLLIFVVYFAAHGVLGDFWSVAYEFNFRYSDIPSGRRLEAFGEMLALLVQSSPYFSLVLSAGLAGMVYLAVSARRAGMRALFTDHPLHFPLIVALIDLPIEFLLINVSGKNYRHYFLSLLPGMSILTAWGLSRLWLFSRRILAHRGTGQRSGIIPANTVGFVGGILLIVLFFCSPLRYALVLVATPWNDMATASTVKFIQSTTRPDDYVLLWGSQTTINFLSGRRSPTRFVHQKPLFRAGYARAEFSAEILEDLREKRPVLIIDTHLPSTPFVEPAADGSCHAPVRPLPEGIDAVFAFICTHYRLETTLTKDQWQVYRLIE